MSGSKVPWNTEFVDNSKVIIKPLAYYKMLVHVLRFGSTVKRRNEYSECMGMLIGELQGDGNLKDVIIHDAVPINHGGRVEVKFAEADYISYAAIDADFFERGWFSVGWYHSHPGLSVFFSAVDIRNQLGFQVPNPSAIGIVWDHMRFEQIEGDMGFKTFRLDDPAKDMSSNYHEVTTIVEPPDGVEYYTKIKELIDAIHNKEPVILEINETPDVFGDVSMPGQSQMMAKQPEIELTEILQALNDGIAKFTSSFFEPLIRYLNKWAQDTSKEVINNNLTMRDSLVGLRNSVSHGLTQLQNWYKFAIMEKFDDADVYIDDKFDLLDENKEELKKALNSLKETIETQLTKLFDEKIKIVVEDLSSVFNESKDKLTSIKSESEKSSENLIQNNEVIKRIADRIKEFNNQVKQDIAKNTETIKSQFTKNLSQFTSDIDEIRKNQEEYISTLDTSLSILENIKTEVQKQKVDSNKPSGGAV